MRLRKIAHAPLTNDSLAEVGETLLAAFYRLQAAPAHRSRSGSLETTATSTQEAGQCGRHSPRGALPIVSQQHARDTWALMGAATNEACSSSPEGYAARQALTPENWCQHGDS
jgi:hypothetical protein